MAPSEIVVGEFPFVRYYLPEPVSVKLTDKAGEVVVFEISGKQISGEIGGLPDDEGSARLVPGNDAVGGRIVDELVGLGEKGRRERPLCH